MEIYIDFRQPKEKVELAQAIRVAALTYKEDIFNVIVGEDTSTLLETDNIKFVRDVDINKLDNLFTTDESIDTSNMIKLMFLKTPKKKEYDHVTLGDLNNNNLSFEEKYNILKKYNFIDKDHKFCLLDSYDKLNKQCDDFISKHQDDEEFEGVLLPKDIVSKDVYNVLTTNEIANIFLDTLYYTVSFLKLQFADESEKPGFFKSMFSFGKPLATRAVVINALIYEFNLYLSNEKALFIAKEEMNYNYYYSSLNFFLSSIK